MRKEFIGYVLLPLLGAVGYLAIAQFVSAPNLWLFFSEQGFFELGTSICFAVAATFACLLAMTGRDVAPRRFRAFCLIIAVAGWFIALEEISFGQHVFGWSSPNWFAANNAKMELNLHNLWCNKPSNVFRYMANIGFPLVGLVMPIAARRLRGDYHPSRWGYYVLPRLELATLVVTAQAFTAVQQVALKVIGHAALVQPAEVQEFYWAVASIVYVRILWQRMQALRGNSRGEAARRFRVESVLRSGTPNFNRRRRGAFVETEH